MHMDIDVESNKMPLLSQISRDENDPNKLLDEHEKILETFRVQANLINKKYPKNSSLSVIEAELIELFNNFLYNWPDGVWKQRDRKKFNIIENIYYSLSYADFKFTMDELLYLLNVWELCKRQRQGNHNNSDMMDSFYAYKVLKMKLLVKKVNIKSTHNRKEIDRRIKQVNMNGLALESILNTLLHNDEFEVVKVFFIVYEKQTTGISIKADEVYHKVIEKVALDLATGCIENMEKECGFFHFLLDHKKVGKTYILTTPCFKELQRVGAKRTLEMVLSKKPFLGITDENGELVISGVGRELLARLFNSLIEPHANNKRVLELDFECFMPSKEYLEQNPEYNEMSLFYHFAADRDFRPLLTHPVVETLIGLKYNKLSVFNWDLIVWRIVVIAIVAFNYLLPYHVTQILSWITFGVLTLSEFYAYFESPSQIRIFLFGLLNLATLSALYMFLYEDCVHNTCPNITGFGCILLAINITFIMCYFSDTVAIYVFMLFNVARNAIKFLAAISIMMLGFAYCMNRQMGVWEDFFLQEIELEEDNKNATATSVKNLLKTVFKTFIMLSGELEAASLPYLNYTSYVVFLVLVFFIPIVSVNLLSGLAIGDVQEIKSNARLWHLTTVTMFLYWYEKGIVRRTSFQSYMESIRSKCLSFWNKIRSFSIKKLLEKNQLKSGKLLTNNRLYKDFESNHKIYLDVNNKLIKVQNQPISKTASHTVRIASDTINAEKLRKRKIREEKNEQRDKAQAKKLVQQMMEKVNRIEKKVDRVTQLEHRITLLSNHIVYLHQTSPFQSKQILDINMKRLRRKSV